MLFAQQFKAIITIIRGALSNKISESKYLPTFIYSQYYILAFLKYVDF